MAFRLLKDLVSRTQRKGYPHCYGVEAEAKVAPIAADPGQAKQGGEFHPAAGNSHFCPNTEHAARRGGSGNGENMPSSYRKGPHTAVEIGPDVVPIELH